MSVKIVLLIDVEAQPTVVALPGPVILGYIRKLTNYEPESEPACSVLWLSGFKFLLEICP